MNKWFLTVLVLPALLLAACQGGRTTDQTITPNESALNVSAELCGDRALLAPQLNLFSWSDYLSDDVAATFESLCGVRVRVDTFSNNEEMIAKIQAGNSGYDLVVPTDYAVDLMIQRGLLAELNQANLPNLRHLDPDLASLYYDPDNRWSVPYQWGTTGIAYNADYFETPPDSWGWLLDPALVCQHRGFVSMLDDEREVIGAALKYLGYSLNDTDPAHHAEAQALLIAQKACLAGYDSDNYNQQLAAGEIVIAQAYSGGGALARDENDRIFFAYPKEGGTIWQDNLAIPKDAPNKYTAEIFINYLLDPEVSAVNTSYTWFFTPVLPAQPLLDADYLALLEEGGFLMTEEQEARMEWLMRSDATRIFTDTWTRIRAR
jgi:spermidine/putrescine transport system substrate-binding protein